MKRAHPSFLFAAALCAGTGAAHAQHVATVAVEIERIENPMLSPVSPGGATVLRLIPNYSFETESERIRSRFTAGAVIERSSNTRLLASREYPTLGYTWGYTWPTASLELRASLAESATRNSELQDAGRVTVDSRERTVVAGAMWTKELTARTRLAIGAENNRVTYDSPLLADYREQEVTTRLTWDAAEQTAYYVEPSYSRLTRLAGGPTATANRWRIGTVQELSPGWSLAASAGQARTDSVRSSTTGVAGVQLTYTGSRWTSSGEWSKDIDAVGFASGYVRTEGLRLRVGYRLTEGATLSASMSRTRSVDFAGGFGSVSSLVLENELSAKWNSLLGVEDRRTRDGAGVAGRGWAVRAGLVYLFTGR